MVLRVEGQAAEIGPAFCKYFVYGNRNKYMAKFRPSWRLGETEAVGSGGAAVNHKKKAVSQTQRREKHKAKAVSWGVHLTNGRP